MSQQKREYTIEFKIDAVKLVEEQGYRAKGTAERLGIPISNLTRWLSQYRKGKLVVGHKQAQPTAEERRVRELEAEVKRLEQEVSILKKASAYFARQIT